MKVCVEATAPQGRAATLRTGLPARRRWRGSRGSARRAGVPGRGAEVPHQAPVRLDRRGKEAPGVRTDVTIMPFFILALSPLARGWVSSHFA